jgi:hypothetical protein
MPALKPKQIRIIYVPLGGPGSSLDIHDDRAALQQLVGGYPEMHAMGRGIQLVCNEDGIALGLPQNGCGILGPYLFLKSDERGESISLNDEECKAVLAYVAVHRMIKHQGGGMEIKSFVSVDDMLAFRERQRFEAEHAN